MNPYHIVAHAQYSLHRNCPKTGWKIEWRALADHELVLITGGKGEAKIEDKVFLLKAGTMLYFSPGLRHAIKSSEESPLSFYGIHFVYLYADFINNQWKYENGKGALPVRNVFEIAAYQKMESLFGKLNRCWNEKTLGYEMICRSALLEILSQCMCHSEVNFASRKRVEEVLAFISQNPGRRITVGELAEMVKLSPDYLAAQFKCVTGFTIIQYMNRSRIDRAKILLLDESRKIREVAEMLGFSDEFYFSRTFKKYEGISPSNFVKNMRNFSE